MTSTTEIAKHFHQHEFFPASATLWQAGEIVYEFPFMQKISETEYHVHIQRHYATDPFTLAERKQWQFSNLVDAFQKWEDLNKGIF